MSGFGLGCKSSRRRRVLRLDLDCLRWIIVGHINEIKCCELAVGVLFDNL